MNKEEEAGLLDVVVDTFGDTDKTEVTLRMLDTGKHWCAGYSITVRDGTSVIALVEVPVGIAGQPGWAYVPETPIIGETCEEAKQLAAQEAALSLASIIAAEVLSEPHVEEVLTVLVQIGQGKHLD